MSEGLHILFLPGIFGTQTVDVAKKKELMRKEIT